jgi:CubicO group peptidase (beta-lactamase class C family)
MTLQRRTFLKQVGLGMAGFSVAPSFPIRLVASEASVHKHLPRSTPEREGVSSVGLLKFLEAVGKSRNEFHSFMMARHGHIVAEGWWAPYRPDAVHSLYSLSKSFTSTAVGFAVAEGKLKVGDRVAKFFPDELPPNVSDNLAALRVEDLLTMSVGHANDSTAIITKENDWVKAFLSLPIEHPPGSAFLYDSGATHMLSAIVQKLSGQKVIDYLQPRLFRPLGAHGMTWETCPRGINTGGWGLSVTTETLAKFGQLYLQKGQWKGKQLLPPEWIEEATTARIQQPATPGAGHGADLEKLKQTSDWHQGYGYQFWRCRHNAFRGDGAFGQFCVVMPEQDAVVAITSNTTDYQRVLNLVWEHLLPGMHDRALTKDVESETQLKRELASLILPLPAGVATSAAVGKIADKSFRLEPNSLGAQSVSFSFRGESCLFGLKHGKSASEVRCGIGRWTDGVTNVPGTPPELTEILGLTAGARRPVRVAAAGAWKDNDTFQMVWRYFETPHHDTVTCRFDEDKVNMEFMNSITQVWLPPLHLETRPVLKGRISI